uniref:RNA-dependent RNA polymerase n=1 Tax=Telmo virus TaxID=2707272 RepID=A0A6H0DHH0_9VIRU|nr:MAG: RNA-dependent RNA polymerase [Telmo virus]
MPSPGQKGRIQMKDSFDLCCQHLRSAGYQGAAEFTDHLRMIAKHSGLEESINICSQIGIYFKMLLAGQSVPRPNCIRMRRFLRNNSKNRIHSPALKAIREAYQALERLTSSPEIDFESKDAKKILALINVKHCFRLKSPSPRMIEKFNTSISAKVNPEEFGKYDTEIKIAAQRLCILFDKNRLPVKCPILSGPSLISYELRSTKSPVLNTDGSIYSRPGCDPVSRQIAPMLHWLATSEDSQVKGSLYLGLDRLIPYETANDDGLSSYQIFNRLDRSGGIPIRGKISHIMESGGKDRVVAQPFLAFQVLFEPLKIFLNKAQVIHPNIYTHSQADGVRIGQSILQHRQKVYCFDASGFTDSFPLYYQTKLLEDLGLKSWAYLLNSFVKDGVWYDSHQDKYVSYAQGQPMGLGPSFALATLTHAALVDGLILSYLRRPPRKEDYAIVGDDIIIGSERLAKAYQLAMERSGVEINLLKSIISNVTGEFCGVLFNRVSKTVPFKPKAFKWQFPALVDALSFYGKSYYKVLDPRSKHLLVAKETPSFKGGLLKRMSILSYAKAVTEQLKSIEASTSLSTRNHIPDYDHLFKMTVSVLENNAREGLLINPSAAKVKPTFADIFQDRSPVGYYIEEFSILQCMSTLISLREEAEIWVALLEDSNPSDVELPYIIEELNSIALRVNSLPLKFTSTDSLTPAKPKLPNPEILAEQHEEDFNKVPLQVELGTDIQDTRASTIDHNCGPTL